MIINLQEREKENATLSADIDACTKQLEQQKKVLITLEKELTKSKKALQHEEQHLHEKITSEISYKNAQTHCLELTTTIAKLKYNPQEHKNSLEDYKALQEEEQQFNELKIKLAQQAERKASIQQLCKNLKVLKKSLGTLELQNVDSSLQALQSKLANKEQLLLEGQKVQQSKKELLLQEKGRLEKQAEILKQQEKELQKNTKSINSLSDTIDQYQTIATALGKDGIQALLIEDALPEIEQEANKILAQLTNNQSHIIIESLRDLKKGGTKETLDIKISDPMGIRPYELFSGGEAFRIDFALRIAISKLLARRAGTSLQTLIIDEGFGSQDEEGLSNLMDAILKIQDDFAKVIIVSHLPAMKDQFPVHFLVEKGPQGSIVSVFEQG